jgi:iron-sulfur cluster repair protein YtfE (RIC family)
MMSEAASVQVEHHALQSHLEAIGKVADSVGETTVEETRAGVENVYEFLNHHLRPHMQAEDQVLYPLLDHLLGTLSATAALRRDHRSITTLIDQLADLRRQLEGGALDRDLVHQLRRTLYGLYLLLTSHFAKEDELYFPLLDERLDAAAAEDLARRMREVTLATA